MMETAPAASSTPKRHKSRSRAVGLAATVIAVLGCAGAGAAPALATTYSVTDLGNLGFQYTEVRGINDNGQATGYSATRKTIEGACSLRFRPCPTHVYHAFLWQAGTMTDLGTLGGNYSEGNAVNDFGEVVGRSELKNGERHAFVFRKGKLTDLDPGLTGREISAAAINAAGVIAGSMSIPGTGHTDATMWSGATVTDLGLLPGEEGIFTSSSGINESDEVTGSGDNRESMERAWVWRNGTMTDIGTLGGPQAAASAINNAGQIVGFAQTSSDANHGFLYANGKMTDLGSNIYPRAINDKGVIVGQGGCGNAIIISGGVCQNLQNLIPANSGFTLQAARGINDTGQIVAYARPENPYASNPIHAVLLTPQ